MLPVTCQTQLAETGTESLWALYSDGRPPEKMASLLPNRLTDPFYKEKKSIGKGVGIQGKVSQIKAAALFHLCLGRWSLSVPWTVGISPWSTMAQIPS